MIVHDLDFLRPFLTPPKYDTPLIVDSDRMPPGEIASQGFQTVPRGRREIAKRHGVVQLHQFSACDLGHFGRKSLWNASLLQD